MNKLKLNVKVVLLVLFMAFLLFVSLVFYQYEINKNNILEMFSNDKNEFNFQISKLLLSHLQTSNYFEIYKNINEIYNPKTMFYISTYDEQDSLIYFLPRNKINSRISSLSKEGVAQVIIGEHQGISITSFIFDKQKKKWGKLEIVYYLEPVTKILDEQIITFTIFLLLFISLLVLIVVYQINSVINPLNIFVEKLSKIQSEWPVSLDYLYNVLTPKKTSREITVLLNIINSSLKQIFEYEKQASLNAKQVAIGQLAAQVAHDIRSPLAVLDMVLQDIQDIKEQKRILIRRAVARIHDIANNLLNSKKPSKEGETIEITSIEEPLRTAFLSSLLENIISEKRTQYRLKFGIEIELMLASSSYTIFTKVQIVEFKRVLSNLINNAVEAFDGPGQVIVDLSLKNNEIEIKIIDNGKGIPQEILEKIGQRGETFNKNGGNGLGVYHAKLSVKAWNGDLRIESVVGKGTVVTIALPKADPPETFVKMLKIKKDSLILVLDDDASIHQIWDEHFKSNGIDKYNIRIIHFSNPEEVLDWHKTSPECPILYLFDYELIGHELSGLDLIERLEIQNKAHLVTSRYDDKEIIEKCKTMQVGLIPKSIAGFVPVFVEDISDNECTVILIDDDELIRTVWATSAKKNNINLKIFSHPDEFFNQICQFSKKSKIYIDSDLGDGLKGENVASELFRLGYRNLFITTGYDSELFNELDFLVGVIGKKPPF